MKRKSNKKNIILRNLLLVLISLLIGFGIYSWNAKSLTGDAMPMPLGFGIGMVMSGSMEPDLSIDDLIFVVPRDDYNVNDVVVFQDGYDLVVHEVIEKDGDMVVTKGKANNSDDGPLNIKYIKGKVVFSLPGFGAAVSVVRSPAVTGIILVLAILLLVRSYRKEDKEIADRENDDLARIKEEIELLRSQMVTENAEAEATPAEDADANDAEE